ncbi:hypothetical protein HO173_011299 [Letharia columbiana]|uniref:Rhodopsin domain-containing protein n=1 Tax=Letharia columbiana TaxID=112416 RepID=A0A8H6FJI4_9LECA|nr:uncharacterized protein HO173_011299 [Letharia columbiana]KAF6229653.1 hypothetical protein HO173_011299 [Letharia columbiana]
MDLSRDGDLAKTLHLEHVPRNIHPKSYRRIVYVLAVTLINKASLSLGCQPLAFFWDLIIPGGHCIDINAFFRWFSLPNILTDVAMLVPPQALVWTLKVTRHQKIGLTLTFLTGSVGLITSIFCFATFFRNDAITDSTFSSVELMSWTIIKPGIYLIAACLPALGPLAQRIFKDSLLTRLSTTWMPKYGDRFYERSTVNIKLEKHRSVRSEVHRPQQCFHRLTDGRESIGKSSGDERSLVDNYGSARDNVSQFARNDCGSDLKAQHIRVENDIVVTTSDSLA